MSAVELIKRWEGLHKVGPDGLIYPYLDPIGIPTIGYGFTDRRIVQSAPHTRPRMDALLDWYVWTLEAQVIRLSPRLAVPANADRLAAIVSFVFNLGIGAYERSALRRKIDAGDWASAAKEAKRWIYASGRVLPGLVARRSDEASLIAA